MVIHDIARTVAEAEFYKGKGEHRFRVTHNGEIFYKSSEGYKKPKDCDKNFNFVVLAKWIATPSMPFFNTINEAVNKNLYTQNMVSSDDRKGKVQFYKSKDKYYWRFKYLNGRIAGSSFKGFKTFDEMFDNFTMVLCRKWKVVKEEK